MSLAELLDIIDGYMLVREQMWERMAWMVAHLVNISGKSIKRPITIKQLLQPARSQNVPERILFDKLWRKIEQQREGTDGDKDR